MKIVSLVALLLAMLAPCAFSADYCGVFVSPCVTINGQSLSLNGAGARDNAALDAYVGSLYTPRPVSTPAELFGEPGDKLLRLDILRDKVEKERILGTFEEGFIKDSPDFATSADAKRFLTLFKVDFYKGDKVDLFLGGDGTVSTSHNGRELGKIKSPSLVRGILKTWFGEKPADEKLKKQMLGNQQP